jgi:hypothetical protein
MTRRTFFALFAIRAPHDVTLGYGLVSANDHERAEGYASIGQGAAVMVKGDTVYRDRLRELTGKQVELIARVQ